MDRGDVDPAPTRVIDVSADTSGEPEALPWPDRAGDHLARKAWNLALRASRLDPDQRGVAGAMAGLVLFLVLVAILGHP